MSIGDPAIGTLVPWFGSKRTLAPEIVRSLGPHAAYWEPFCGSMAVLLSKPRCTTEVVNDLHGDLINLARVFQDPALGPKLYRRLRRVLMCEETFRRALASIRGEPPGEDLGRSTIDPDRAYAYFITSWQGMNGFAGTGPGYAGFSRVFTSTRGSPGQRWTHVIRSIPGWRRRLAGVQVMRTDGIALCEKIEDRRGTVLYCDPPYLVQGKDYLHDFAAADHERLAMVLHRFRRTRVVVSYYNHERLERLYPGWHARSPSVAKGIARSRRNGKGGRVAAPEVLLSNLPLDCLPDQLSLFGRADEPEGGPR